MINFESVQLFIVRWYHHLYGIAFCTLFRSLFLLGLKSFKCTTLSPLATIGVLRPMQVIQTMHGMLTLTMAIRTTIIRVIVIMFGVLGAENKNKKRLRLW
jgi:hypothetical protein